MIQNGLALKKFEHYLFTAGENRGEPVTVLQQSELSRSLNVEQRGKGICPRLGSSIRNVVADVAVPIGNFGIQSGFGMTYGDDVNVDIFTGDDNVYVDSETPASIDSGLTVDAKFQFEQVGDVTYMANGTDPVLFYEPLRSTSTTYTSGYDTPAAFNAAADATVSTRPAGDYSYFVTLYDQNTQTESNRQAVAVTHAGALINTSTILTNLPIDSEARTTHWRIYRKDPSGYYYYDLVQITYDAGTPTYVDSITSTGRTRIAPNDNDRPDPSKAICQHGKVMLFGEGNVLSWSKAFRYQNVPTFNRDYLDDDSSEIQRIISYKGTAVVFKSRSIYTVTGDFTEGSIEIKRISTRIGTVSPASVWEAPDGIFFFGSDGKPRFITSTDFQSEDLRDETDISYKYRDKFNELDAAQYSNVFAIYVNYKTWNQYRIFIPSDSDPTYSDTVFIFDINLANRNGGASGWFTWRYNIKMQCAWIARDEGEAVNIRAGDNYSLLWDLDKASQLYDGGEFESSEAESFSISGVNDITFADADDVTLNQYRGMMLIVYDRYTFNEVFRSRVTSNTASPSPVFTLQDAVPSIPTATPYCTVGGYLTYFGTAHFTYDRSGRNRPFAMSMLLGFNSEFPTNSNDVYVFTNYDFNDIFNYTYDYINTPANPSRSPRGDIYLLSVGIDQYMYDAVDSVYGTATYTSFLYETSEFPLRNKYLFNHVSWGIITREPSRPFLYLGSSYFFQYKALTRPLASAR